MSLGQDELLNSGPANAFPTNLRASAFGPGSIATKVFAAGSVVLAELTAVAQVGANIVPYAYIDGSFTENTSEAIVGFVWPDPVTLLAANETNGGVLLQGEVDYRDVPTPVVGTDEQLQAALADIKVRKRGLNITGGLPVSL